MPYHENMSYKREFLQLYLDEFWLSSIAEASENSCSKN